MPDTQPWRDDDRVDWQAAGAEGDRSDDYLEGATLEVAPGDGYIPVALPDTPATVTKVLVGLIVAVFLLGVVVGPRALSDLARKDNIEILRNGQYYRLLTVMFLHGGLAHLFMNTYALWIIGQDVERFYGHLRFLAIFLLGGLAASVASLALTPGPAVGASGAVFAVFAAEMVLLYRNRGLFGEGARQRLRSLVLLLVLNAAIGVAGAAFIDNWAHIGGFLGGAVVSWLLVPTYRVVPPATPDGPARLDEAALGANVWLVAALWLALVVTAVAWLTARSV